MNPAQSTTAGRGGRDGDLNAFDSALDPGICESRLGAEPWRDFGTVLELLERPDLPDAAVLTTPV